MPTVVTALFSIFRTAVFRFKKCYVENQIRKKNTSNIKISVIVQTWVYSVINITLRYLHIRNPKRKLNSNKLVSGTKKNYSGSLSDCKPSPIVLYYKSFPRLVPATYSGGELKNMKCLAILFFFLTRF